MFFVVLALFLLICGGLVVLTVQNLSTPVPLVFYTWHTPTVPVALWIVGAFLLGTLLLYLISVASALDDHRELRKLRKRVSELEEEKMRSLSLGPARIPTSPLASGDPQIPVGPARIPTPPLPSGDPQILAGPRRIPTSPLGLDPQVPVGPTRVSTEPLELPSSFIPMPGIHTSPPNSGASALPMPDFRQ
jgi:uncharacterized integral membrane protein